MNDQMGAAIPPLESSEDTHFPSDYASIRNYFFVSKQWQLTEDPLDTKTLNNRKKTHAFNNLQRKKNNAGGRGKGKRASLKKTKKDFEFDSLPYQMWFTMSVRTKANDIEDILTGLNIDLKATVGVFASLKGVQCWKSLPKYMLTCVNSNLCAQGVHSILERSLIKEQRKQCKSGKLSTVDYYDKPLPPIRVYLKAMREIRGLPDDEKEEYSIDPYPMSTRFVYYLEASKDAWSHLDKLLKEYTASGRINNDFGRHATRLSRGISDRLRLQYSHHSFGLQARTVLVPPSEGSHG